MRVLHGGLFCLFLSLLIVTVSGCASSGEEVSDLAGTAWELVSYGEPGSETPVIEETEVTLQFEEEDQASGSGGCNTFTAQCEVSDGSLSFRNIVSTLRSCSDEAVMEQEKQYYQALETAGEFEVTEDQLRIWYDDGQSVLNFVRVETP